MKIDMRFGEIIILLLFIAFIIFLTSFIATPPTKTKTVGGFASIISAQENNRLQKPTPTLATQELRFGRSLIPETTLIK